MSGVYRAASRLRGSCSAFFEPWESLEFDTQELIELPDGRVLTGGRASDAWSTGAESR